MLTCRLSDHAFRIRENARCDSGAFKVMFYQTRNVGIIFDDKNRALHTRILAGVTLAKLLEPLDFARSFVNTLLIFLPDAGALADSNCFVFLRRLRRSTARNRVCHDVPILSSVE